MGVLTSKQFTEGDPAVVKKLEDCALGRPYEVLSHFKQGHSGEHIKRVQEALKAVQELEPGLGIPDFAVNGVYDSTFAEAVFVYKGKRNILNYAKKVDDVIGIKTIRSLDQDATRKRRVEPPPKLKKPGEFPRPLPACVPHTECPSSKDFSVTVLMGLTGGEGVELAKIWFTIRDTRNGFSALYLFRGAGASFGSPLTPIDGGGPKAFSTTEPVKVTGFGPGALLTGATHPPPFQIISANLLVLDFNSAPGKGARRTGPIPIDMGVINLPGASALAGQFKLLSLCKGKPGAVRRPIALLDLPQMED